MARDKEGRRWNDLEIRNDVDTLMFEGHDTTTSGMSWSLYCLAKHPPATGQDLTGGEECPEGKASARYDDVKNYTTWCIKEAMRVYPPVFSFFRKTT